MNRYRVLTSALALAAVAGAVSAGSAGAVSNRRNVAAGVTGQHCKYHGDQEAMNFNDIVVVKALSCRTAVRAINQGHFSNRAFTFTTHGFDCTASGHSGGVAHECVKSDGAGRFYFDTSPD